MKVFFLAAGLGFDEVLALRLTACLLLVAGIPFSIDFF